MCDKQFSFCKESTVKICVTQIHPVNMPLVKTNVYDYKRSTKTILIKQLL